MFKSYFSRGLTLASAFTVSLFVCISAFAAPFTIDLIEPLGFACNSAAPPSGPGSLTCPVGTTPNQIQWVEDLTPVSELELISLTPVLVVPGAGPAQISRLRHSNKVIPTAFNYSIDIVSRVQVTDNDGGAVVSTTDGANPIRIQFTETGNNPPCTNPTPNATECDDFFEFSTDGLSPVNFSAGGIDYTMIFAVLPGAGAAFDGVIPNRVYTAENATSELFITAQIVANQVPEPMGIALFGLGLLGIGLSTRARKI